MQQLELDGGVVPQALVVTAVALDAGEQQLGRVAAAALQLAAVRVVLHPATGPSTRQCPLPVPRPDVLQRRLTNTHRTAY